MIMRGNEYMNIIDEKEEENKSMKRRRRTGRKMGGNEGKINIILK